MSSLGYQEEVDEPESSTDPKRDDLIVGAVLIAFYLFLDTLSWLTERGGIFSILAALFSVHSRPRVMNIDENGLRLPIFIIIWLVMVGACRLFHIRFDMSSRAKALVPVLVIIGGGFVLDGVLGEPIISHYMAGHGYSRCVIGDWEQGNGKSRVSFANYVLTSGDCQKHQP
jgi:hypothetical protein